jgi:hypothetical protein
MIKIVLRMVLVLALLISIGCAILRDPEFTANIDGTEFNSTFGLWTEISEQGLEVGQIIATDDDGTSFSLSVTGAFEVKTYTLGMFGTDTADALVIYTDLQGTTYGAESGTLTITSKANFRLQGNFEMTLIGITGIGEGVMLEVTNGQFDLPGLAVPSS